MENQTTIATIKRMAAHLGVQVSIERQCIDPYRMPLVSHGSDELVTCSHVKGYWYWLHTLSRENRRTN